MARRSGQRMMRKAPGAKTEPYDEKKLEQWKQDAAKAADKNADKPTAKPADK